MKNRKKAKEIYIKSLIGTLIFLFGISTVVWLGKKSSEPEGLSNIFKAAIQENVSGDTSFLSPAIHLREDVDCGFLIEGRSISFVSKGEEVFTFLYVESVNALVIKPSDWCLVINSDYKNYDSIITALGDFTLSSNQIPMKVYVQDKREEVWLFLPLPIYRPENQSK